MAKAGVQETTTRAAVSPVLRVALLLVALAILAVMGEEVLRAWSAQSLDLDDALLLLTYLLSLAATVHYFVRGMLPVSYAAAIALVTVVRYLSMDLSLNTPSDFVPLAAGAFALLLALVVLYSKHRRQ